ncbi:MAG: glycerol kinase, partial [bacterium]
TALGATYLAGLAVGYWKDFDEIWHQWQIDKTFEPKMDRAQVEELSRGWQKALERAKGWVES